MKKNHIGTFIFVALTVPLALILPGCRGGAGSGTGALSVLPAAREPLMVSSTNPFNNETGVLPDAVITFKFSKAVKNLTQATFTLSNGVNNIEGTLTLDATNTIATFMPANPLTLSTAYRATLSSGVTDHENNPLTLFSWSFMTRDVVSWTFVDGNGKTGINHDGTKDVFFPQLTAFNFRLYATWRESNGTAYQIRVAVYNGNDSAPAWTLVDGNGPNGINKDATQDGYNPQLTVYGSKLYATWYESTDQASQIRVAIYNGNDSTPAWAFVDGNSVNGINHDVTRSAFDPQLAVLGSKLYVAWKEKSAAGHQIRVAVSH